MNSIQSRLENPQVPNTDSDFADLNNSLAEALQSSEDFILALVKKIGQELESSVKASSDTLVNGLSSIKEELSISKKMKENPWGWIGAAGLVGLSMSLFLNRNPRSHVIDRDSNTTSSINLISLRPLAGLLIAEAGAEILRRYKNRDPDFNSTH